jgi:hypothetical protein
MVWPHARKFSWNGVLVPRGWMTESPFSSFPPQLSRGKSVRMWQGSHVKLEVDDSVVVLIVLALVVEVSVLVWMLLQ